MCWNVTFSFLYIDSIYKALFPENHAQSASQWIHLPTGRHWDNNNTDDENVTCRSCSTGPSSDERINHMTTTSRTPRNTTRQMGIHRENQIPEHGTSWSYVRLRQDGRTPMTLLMVIYFVILFSLLYVYSNSVWFQFHFSFRVGINLSRTYCELGIINYEWSFVFVYISLFNLCPPWQSHRAKLLIKEDIFRWLRFFFF